MPPCTEIIVRAPWSSARPATERAALAASGNSAGRAVARPAGVVEQRAPVLQLAQHLGQRVLDRLVGADRASERVALLGVGDGHLQRRLDAAERLGRDQGLRQMPGAGERLLAARRATWLARLRASRGRASGSRRSGAPPRPTRRSRSSRSRRPTGLPSSSATPTSRSAPGASGTKASVPLTSASAFAVVLGLREPTGRVLPWAGSTHHPSTRSLGGIAGR